MKDIIDLDIEKNNNNTENFINLLYIFNYYDYLIN
jgi:hypothetical protein